MSEQKIAVRYCGGCNSWYDRGAFVRGLEAAFPGVTLRPYTPGESYDAVLVVCGCPVRCAEQQDLPEGVPRFAAVRQADYDRAAAFIDALCAGNI